MNTLVNKAQARGLRFSPDMMWVELADGRQLGVPLVYFPRLLHASPTERERFTISGGGTGLHWNELDEDISVSGLLIGVGDRTKKRTPPLTQKKAS